MPANTTSGNNFTTKKDPVRKQLIAKKKKQKLSDALFQMRMEAKKVLPTVSESEEAPDANSTAIDEEDDLDGDWVIEITDTDIDEAWTCPFSIYDAPSSTSSKDSQRVGGDQVLEIEPTRDDVVRQSARATILEEDSEESLPLLLDMTGDVLDAAEEQAARIQRYVGAYTYRVRVSAE